MDDLSNKTVVFSFLTLVINHVLILTRYNLFDILLNPMLSFQAIYYLYDFLIALFDVLTIISILYLASKLYDPKQKLLIVEKNLSKLKICLIIFLIYAVVDLIMIIVYIFSGETENTFSLVETFVYISWDFRISRLNNPDTTVNMFTIISIYFLSIIENVQFVLLVTFGIITLFLHQNNSVEIEGDIDIYPKPEGQSTETDIGS